MLTTSLPASEEDVGACFPEEEVLLRLPQLVRLSDLWHEAAFRGRF